MALLPKGLIKVLMFPILIVALLVLNSLIEPMKILTDLPRNAMNCPATASFNATAWSAMTGSQHMIYSTGCYALNGTVIGFIGLLTILAIWGWMSK
jgi:hypothetical protein